VLSAAVTKCSRDRDPGKNVDDGATHRIASHLCRFFVSQTFVASNTFWPTENMKKRSTLGKNKHAKELAIDAFCYARKTCPRAGWRINPSESQQVNRQNCFVWLQIEFVFYSWLQVVAVCIFQMHLGGIIVGLKMLWRRLQQSCHNYWTSDLKIYCCILFGPFISDFKNIVYLHFKLYIYKYSLSL